MPAETWSAYGRARGSRVSPSGHALAIWSNPAFLARGSSGTVAGSSNEGLPEGPAADVRRRGDDLLRSRRGAGCSRRPHTRQ